MDIDVGESLILALDYDYSVANRCHSVEVLKFDFKENKLKIVGHLAKETSKGRV